MSPDATVDNAGARRYVSAAMETLDEPLFDRIAADELKQLEKKLGDIDPDTLDVELSMDVLTLTTGAGEKIVINSHRAARQIWMAAFRRAWHFTPHTDGAAWRWATATDELHATLRQVLRDKIGLEVKI